MRFDRSAWPKIIHLEISRASKFLRSRGFDSQLAASAAMRVVEINHDRLRRAARSQDRLDFADRIDSARAMINADLLKIAEAAA